MKKYFVYDLDQDNVSVPVETCYGDDLIGATPTINNYLNYAIWYDTNVHPDETYFVTTNKQVADEANLYLGEDSIILLT